MNCLFELIVFGLVEIFTRHVFSRKRCSRLVLLSSQLGFLVTFVVFILVDHVPYLLLLTIVGVMVRMIYASLQTSRNQYISKPLPNAMKSSSRTDPKTPQSRMPLPQMGNFRPRSSLPNNYFHPTGYSIRGTQENRYLQRRPLSNPQGGIQSKLLPQIRNLQKSSLSKFPPLNYIQSMFDFKHSPDPRPPGLINSGNTCFINSTLQCLTWTPGFAEGLASIVTESNVFVTTLLQLMFRITHQTDQHDSTISPSDFLFLMSTLAPHLVTNRSGLSFQSQQDSAEFLLWLLNHIHTEAVKNFTVVSNDFIALKEDKQTRLAELSIMKSNGHNFGTKVLEYSELDWYLYTLQAKSPIYEQCLGQILEARECQLCHKVSINIDYFMVLPLPLPKSTGAHDVIFLDDCFNSFSHVEELTGSNMITCSCIVPNEQSLTPGTRIALLGRAPRTLIMQLSRYTYDISLQATVKNKACVRFNTTFQVPISIESQLGVPSKSPTPVVYKLVGVCVHSGADNTSYGHYVAYCLTSTGWCYFNDDTVSKVSDIEEALKDYFILQNAYLLFYSCF